MLKEILVLSDFNARILTDMFINNFKDLNVVSAPYKQVFQILYDNDSEYIKNDQLVICWTQANLISNEFSKCIQNLPFDEKLFINEIERFCELIKHKTEKVKLFFIPLWIIEENTYFTGVNCLKNTTSPIYVLNLMNQFLINFFKDDDNVVLFDTNQFLINSKSTPFNQKYWYFTKTLFDVNVFTSAYEKMYLTLQEIQGKSKKMLIIDLDNTIWGGVIGDDGIENIVLGGHSPHGEAFKDFQIAIKSLKNKGIILAICSKNDEDIVLNCFENHPEMILKKDDFAIMKINWEDKVKNIIEIVDTINIGLDSVVFLDDNINERERVKSSLPDVFVPEMPNDPLYFKSFLLNLNCFNITYKTNEDLNRTMLYKDEENRKSAVKKYQNIEDWLKTIGTIINVEKLNENNIKRVSQLFNKTNQMNLQTRRLSEADLRKIINDKKTDIFAFYVKDNFGDLGLTGILGLTINNSEVEISDFILSCRILNRKIEESILIFAVNYAYKNNVKKIIANYKKTDRNQICLRFFENSFFERNKNNFFYNIKNEISYFDYISMNEIN